MRDRAPDAIRATAKTVRDGLEETRFRVWRSLSQGPRLERPVFVIGCPRSGTSLTVRLLARHPDVVNWSEAGRIWDPQGYDEPEAEHCWSVADVEPADARRLHARFEHRRRRDGRPRFVNKHPRSTVRIDYIDAIFPDAFYLHVIRDGRAVVNSILARVEREPYRQAIPFGDFCKPPGWRSFLRDDPAEQAALQWREIVRYARTRGPSLDGRYLEFRYEDLCRVPRTVMADVYASVGLRVTERMLETVPERFHNENDKYRTRLTPDQVATVERVAGDLLAELGYLGVP